MNATPEPERPRTILSQILRAWMADMGLEPVEAEATLHNELIWLREAVAEWIDEGITPHLIRGVRALRQVVERLPRTR